MATLINRQTRDEGQHYDLVSVWHTWSRPVRIRIRRDTYDQQSYAVAEILTPNAWQELHHLLTPAVLGVNRHVRDKRQLTLAALADEETLLEQAGQILEADVTGRVPKGVPA